MQKREALRHFFAGKVNFAGTGARQMDNKAARVDKHILHQHKELVDQPHRHEARLRQHDVCARCGSQQRNDAHAVAHDDNALAAAIQTQRALMHTPSQRPRKHVRAHMWQLELRTPK